MFYRKRIAALALVMIGLLGATVPNAAYAAGAGSVYFARLKNSVSISNNSGGRIIDYARKAAQFRNSKATVRFAGRCDSACTLYLGLPKHQTCISPGAYFRFHSPSARSQRSARMAQAYLMRKYPGWVKSWIAQNGGLSGQLVTMDYSYASKFMKSCARVASR
jgi:hypothetical protein